MFGGGPGPWREDPPFHTPVFVPTHRAGPAGRGRPGCAAGGGADVVQQYLAAGLVDEFWLHLVPVLLGDGRRLLEDVGDLHLEQVRAIEAPGVTHLKYRVVKGGEGRPA
jgi:dihydrofolate reductase